MTGVIKVQSITPKRVGGCSLKFKSTTNIHGGEIMNGKSYEQGWGVFKWERIKLV